MGQLAQIQAKKGDFDSALKYYQKRTEIELRSHLPLQSYRALEYYWIAEYALK